MSDTQTLMQRCSSMVPDKYATILLAASGYAGAFSDIEDFGKDDYDVLTIIGKHLDKEFPGYLAETRKALELLRESHNIPADVFGTALNQTGTPENEPRVMVTVYSEDNHGVVETLPDKVNIAPLLHAAEPRLLASLLKELRSSDGYLMYNRDEVMDWMRENESVANPSADVIETLNNISFDRSEPNNIESLNMTIEAPQEVYSFIKSYRPDVIAELEKSAPVIATAYERASTTTSPGNSMPRP